MFMDAIRQLKSALLLLVFLIVLTGLIYPTVITGVAQLCFPWTANGSLLESHGKVVGSALIGQFFDAPIYFWGRPSATAPFPYNAANSTGSNLGPSNPSYLDLVKKRIETMRTFHPKNRVAIPVDLVTASGSGLDPDISLLSARYQVARIAQARHIPAKKVEALISKLAKHKSIYSLELPRISVLELNMALDNDDRKSS